MGFRPERLRRPLHSFKHPDKRANEPVRHFNRRRQPAAQQHDALPGPHVHHRAAGSIPAANLDKTLVQEPKGFRVSTLRPWLFSLLFTSWRLTTQEARTSSA